MEKIYPQLNFSSLLLLLLLSLLIGEAAGFRGNLDARFTEVAYDRGKKGARLSNPDCPTPPGSNPVQSHRKETARLDRHTVQHPRNKKSGGKIFMILK